MFADGRHKRIAIALAAVGLVLGAALPAVSASASVRYEWRQLSTRLPAGGWVDFLTAPARDDAWLVGTVTAHGGSKVFFMHWTGKRWHTVTVPHPAGFVPSQLLSTSAANVWAFGTVFPASGGADFYALVYNGHRWITRGVPAGVTGDAGAVVSTTSVWSEEYGGDTGCGPALSGCGTELAHWNGASWSSSEVADYAVQLAAAGGRAWVAGLQNVTFPHGPLGRARGTLSVLEWSSGRWRQIAAPAGRFSEVSQLVASPNGELWLMTVGATHRTVSIYQRKHGAWTKLAVPAGLGLQQLAYDGRHGIWASIDRHWTGTRWDYIPPGEVSVAQMTPIPSSGSAWGWSDQFDGSRHVAWLAVYGPLP
jgi:hypothetical protein